MSRLKHFSRNAAAGCPQRRAGVDAAAVVATHRRIV